MKKIKYLKLALFVVLVLLPARGWSYSMTFGGHIKTHATASFQDSDTLYRQYDDIPFLDGQVDIRLKHELNLNDWITLQTHYEGIYLGGDTLESQYRFSTLLPASLSQFFMIHPESDDTRLMDLSHTVSDVGSDHPKAIFFHRLDRLYISMQPSWGNVSIGRQALTWGNGLIFNPMDLFNPFSPSEIDRDYKVGDDLLSMTYNFDNGNVTCIYVPRRDIDSQNVTSSASSFAGKVHLFYDTHEFDIMAAYHYTDYVLGLGSLGYLGGAVWRMDATWTILDPEKKQNDYFAFVANMDYSWVFLNKNFYGLIEFYYQDLGVDFKSESITAVFDNPELENRLARGELFTLGHYYLSGEIRMEVHPLVNIYLTLIDNVKDPSGKILPRMIWDVTQNMQLTAGATVNWGKINTEYGGFELPGTPFTYKASDSLYCWLAWFF